MMFAGEGRKTKGGKGGMGGNGRYESASHAGYRLLPPITTRYRHETTLRDAANPNV